MSAGFDLFLFSTDPATLRDVTMGRRAGAVIDWEHVGKRERQRGVDTQVNSATVDDLRSARRVVNTTLICRLNGVGSHTRAEVECALEAGADELLVPMVRTPAEVEMVLRFAAGRGRVGFLVETRDAVTRIAEFAQLPVSRVYVGLFDLLIERRSANLFMPLVDGTLERIRESVGVPFGFGGLTLPERGAPIPCRLLIGEMARLDCAFSFLRRSFLADAVTGERGLEVTRIADAVARARLRGGLEVTRDRDALVQRIGAWRSPDGRA